MILSFSFRIIYPEMSFRKIFLIGLVLFCFSAEAKPKPAIQESQNIPKQMFENRLSNFQCAPYTSEQLKKKDKNETLKKSEVVQEIYALLSTRKDFESPPETPLIRFYDINQDAPFYRAAQTLRALKILDSPQGYFGNAKDPDPIVNREETQKFLDQSFENTKCGFTQNNDMDKDGIENRKDRCPTLAAPKTQDGCPVLPTTSANNTAPKTAFFSSINSTSFTNPNPRVLVNIAPGNKDYTFVERTELKVNDIIKAVFLNPKTGAVISESNTLKVTK